MKKINPLELFLWTFRRNEKDVINLYNSLSGVMQLATGGRMLNFGYWDKSTNSPILAQKNLCSLFGKFAKLESAKNVIDVGSGFGAPAFHWAKEYPQLNISCVNINKTQLRDFMRETSIESSSNIAGKFESINSTSTMFPFRTTCVDRVIALESAQHFKPLRKFISESRRVLNHDGILSLAIPVMVKQSSIPFTKLGTLSFTWSSEHYGIEFVKNLLKNEGFKITEELLVGSNVYEPLSNYYMENRQEMQNRILKEYPRYVEQILAKSLIKMKKISEKKIIDYLLISAKNS